MIARAIDQDVEPRQGGDQRRDRRRVAHVELARVAAPERRLRRALPPPRVRVAPVTVTTRRSRERIGNRRADAARAARNERDAAGEKIVAKRRADHAARSSSARTSASRGSGATAPNPVVASAAAAFA